MEDHPPLQKPTNVLYAEWALWIWTAWTCLFGIGQSWLQIPEIETAMTDQLQGIFTVPPRTLLAAIIGCYGVLALASAWVVWKIGIGKNWARKSLLWGFVLEVLWIAVPPYSLSGFLSDIPDFGLQGYALYLLYTAPGKGWFARKP